MDSSTAPLFADPGKLVCRPVQLMDILKYLVFNYVLHAATVLSTPGEGLARSILDRVFVFCFPIHGTLRAISAIHRFSRWQKTHLKVALRARGLCMLTATNNHPKRWKVLSDDVNIQGQHPVDMKSSWNWPENANSESTISLVVVPKSFTVEPCLPDGPKDPKIACNYNFVKILAAIVQIVYGSIQLYQSSGPQFEKYGYAAYELTIIPYTFMSLINLLAALCEPEFPTMFLVRRVPEDEISAEVGCVTGETDQDLINMRMGKNQSAEILIFTICFLLVAGAMVGPYLIIWRLTGFKAGRDAGSRPPEVAWRPISSWIVVWLVYGQISTLFTFFNRMAVTDFIVAEHKTPLLILGVVYALGGVGIAIYGFSSIIRLMANDTICTTI